MKSREELLGPDAKSSVDHPRAPISGPQPSASDDHAVIHRAGEVNITPLVPVTSRSAGGSSRPSITTADLHPQRGYKSRATAPPALPNGKTIVFVIQRPPEHLAQNHSLQHINLIRTAIDQGFQPAILFTNPVDLADESNVQLSEMKELATDPITGHQLYKVQEPGTDLKGSLVELVGPRRRGVAGVVVSYRPTLPANVPQQIREAFVGLDVPVIADVTDIRQGLKDQLAGPSIGNPNVNAQSLIAYDGAISPDSSVAEELERNVLLIAPGRQPDTRPLVVTNKKGKLVVKNETIGVLPSNQVTGHEHERPGWADTRGSRFMKLLNQPFFSEGMRTAMARGITPEQAGVGKDTELSADSPIGVVPATPGKLIDVQQPIQGPGSLAG